MARKMIDKCPHCGSAEGFYTLSDYINVPLKIGFDGSERDNSEMYDCVTDIRYHRYAYCLECGEVIGNASTMVRQIGDK